MITFEELYSYYKSEIDLQEMQNLAEFIDVNENGLIDYFGTCLIIIIIRIHSCFFRIWSFYRGEQFIWNILFS